MINHDSKSIEKKRTKEKDNNIIIIVIKIYKPPLITTCDVSVLQNLVSNLTREETPAHEQQQPNTPNT